MMETPLWAKVIAFFSDWDVYFLTSQEIRFKRKGKRVSIDAGVPDH